MSALPALTQFRLDPQDSGVVHLVFDCPGRTMNVFSEAAIADIGQVAAWLTEADVRGLLIRSGKANAFCAGADLTELGLAYDMIVAAPARARFDLAFDHFFRFSKALRALETAGKPVAAAVAGLALGGGCEFALAAHHRVLADDRNAAMGLPESLVGLLPGAGGTQRLPRLIDVEAALPILLDGARLSGAAALEARLVHELTPLGGEIAAAEAWLLGRPAAQQAWDVPAWEPMSPWQVSALIAPVREAVLSKTRGHYPALLAILDCVEGGLPQPIDGAIRTEMSVFARLIQREEPRNMIQTLFLAKTEHDRLRRKDALPPAIAEVVAAVTAAIAAEDAGTLSRAGFGQSGDPLRRRAGPGYWIDGADGSKARQALARVGAAAASAGAPLDEDGRRVADYAVVAATGYPGYLGGPFAYARRTARS